ncbi:hypothetical protein BJY52DRAFT_404809 [Lactarius psammicola]|nr:hypothetical protein BJY52DRAFT_404809 [Lactarius psammicola]
MYPTLRIIDGMTVRLFQLFPTWMGYIVSFYGPCFRLCFLFSIVFIFRLKGHTFALFFVLLSGFAKVVVAHEFDKVTQTIAIDADLMVAYLFDTWLNPEGVG